MEKNRLNELLSAVEKLKRSEIKDLVEARLKEFRANREKSSREIFKELCFCILTANFNAERCIKISEELGEDVLNLPEAELNIRLKALGHRYPKTRAKYIIEARKYAYSLKSIIEKFEEGKKLRKWLVENIKGLGYKEASHFLRNIGFTNLAIIDFHIINLLVNYGLIEKPKTITRKKYLEIEGLLREIADKLDLNLAELDLYLWYLETSKVLK